MATWRRSRSPTGRRGCTRVPSRNLNTDESIADGTTIRVETNAGHHAPLTASHVVLPVEVDSIRGASTPPPL